MIASHPVRWVQIQCQGDEYGYTYTSVPDSIDVWLQAVPVQRQAVT